MSVRSFLPPHASRPQNKVLTCLQRHEKLLFFFIIVILAQNASFTCQLRRHLLASMPLTTPKPQNTDTNGIHVTWS